MFLLASTLSEVRLKVGFHFPSSRAELTAQNSGAFFDTRQLG